MLIKPLIFTILNQQVSSESMANFDMFNDSNFLMYSLMVKVYWNEIYINFVFSYLVLCMMICWIKNDVYKVVL